VENVAIVDSFGCMDFYMEQPSYDIEIEEDGGRTLMKHIPESDVLKKHGTKDTLIRRR
jgi:hypothetical protein